MLSIRSFVVHAAWIAAVVSAMAVGQARAAAAPADAGEKERPLIGVLQSNAPPQEKAITCKRLAVCGSKAAVPALARSRR